ncbi:MAG: MauE/DoxX family redox-associated membrane protein [Xanthobacteraceae bacterium]|nr:MauE/DoxX family redox-associated membrane protein [Xanthobacteraceae bacterium]
MTAMVDPLIHVAAAGFIVVVLARAVGGKLHDYALYTATLTDYRLLPAVVVPAAAAGLVTAEALAVVLLLVPSASAVGAALAMALFGLYGLAMALALFGGRTEIECGCGGEGQLVSWGLVARNAVLVGISGSLILPMTARAMGWLDFLFGAVAVAVVCLLLAIAEKTIGTAAVIRRLDTHSYH